MIYKKHIAINVIINAIINGKKTSDMKVLMITLMI